MAHPNTPLLDTTGVVLAGGRSTRMGRSKAQLLIAGEPLLARVVRRVRLALAEVIVVGPTELQPLVPGVSIMQEVVPGLGPLAGVAAALGAIRTPWACAVACDMPFVQPALVRALADVARANPDADVVALRTEHGTEYLHAVYARSCLPYMSAQLEDGNRSLKCLFAALRVLEVHQRDVTASDPDGLSAFNANSLEEWASALVLADQYPDFPN
jgi:molybdopterin-guanine dinucleotide biosynthesis protein A